MRIGAKLIFIFIISGLVTTFVLSWIIELYKYQKRLVSVENVIENTAYLERILTEIYPEKLPKEKMQQIQTLINNLKHEKTKKVLPIKAFSLIQPIFSAVNDQNLRFMVPSEPVYSVLPFRVQIIDKNAIVTSTATDKIPAGAKILSINKIPIENLIDQLLPYTSGENYELREQQLSQLIWLSPELLWKKQRFVWIFYNQEEYEVQYTFENQQKTEKVKTVTLFSYPTLSAKYQSIGSEPPYTFERIDDVGIIKIRTFSLSGTSYNRFREFLDNTIIYNKDLKKIIIDIRNSQAQDFNIFKEIYEHLIQSNIKFTRNISLINTAYVLKTLEKYGIEFTQSTGEILNQTFSHEFKPREPNIKAEVWLLFDKYTNNAALDFAYTFKKLNPGRTIGEPTLTKINHTTDITYQYLDSIRLALTYPTSKINETDGDKPLEPDHIIQITTKDRINYLKDEKDEVMQKALEIVRK